MRATKKKTQVYTDVNLIKRISFWPILALSRHKMETISNQSNVPTKKYHIPFFLVIVEGKLYFFVCVNLNTKN